MIFTCDKCGARTATPSSTDGRITEVDCGACGARLTASKHGKVVAPKSASTPDAMTKPSSGDDPTRS